jgi:hypothetical protein
MSDHVPLPVLIEEVLSHVVTLEKNFLAAYQPYELCSDIADLYSLQNCLVDLDVATKKIAKIQSRIKPDFDDLLKKRVDAEEFEYGEHIIVPVMKKLNRSVDEDTLKQYYKPFFERIIEAKTTILEKTYKVSIKDVETFMGSLAEKVIKQGTLVIDRYEIRVRE